MSNEMTVAASGVVPDASAARDLLAISRLQSAYADAITRRAFDDLRSLFLADCSIRVDTVSREPMVFVGPGPFGDFVEQAVARFDFFEFVILNAIVDLGVDGAADVAQGRMFMCEHRHDADAEGSQGWSTAYGRYVDRYQRVDGRWWFASRSYRSLARTGADGLVLPGSGE